MRKIIWIIASMLIFCTISSASEMCTKDNSLKNIPGGVFSHDFSLSFDSVNESQLPGIISGLNGKLTARLSSEKSPREAISNSLTFSGKDVLLINSEHRSLPYVLNMKQDVKNSSTLRWIIPVVAIICAGAATYALYSVRSR